MGLHVNPIKGACFEMPCHAHDWGHVRMLFAGDKPGPDGRVGWWEKAYSPIKDMEAVDRNHAKADTSEDLRAIYYAQTIPQLNQNNHMRGLGFEPECVGWREERNHHVRGNGPDSARWIPAGWRHVFTLLSATGYHQCFYHHRDTEGKITPVYEGVRSSYT